MSPERPTCFVAMPLTTPANAVDSYGGDLNHFIHVLDHLFAPAVTKAGFRLVKPLMTGADLIQAEIIRSLEESDIVLCDISLHNPNVFFELGIRTALDRPVALIKDNLTDKLPFDTGILNTYTYDASLSAWTLADEIEQLANHLQVTVERSRGGNPLWKYFGLTRRAEPEPASADPLSAKLDVVLAELRQATSTERHGKRLDAAVAAVQPKAGVKKVVRPRPPYLSRSMGSALPTDEHDGELPEGLSKDVEDLLLDLSGIADKLSARLWVQHIEGKHIDLDARPFSLGEGQWEEMSARALQSGFALSVTHREGSFGSGPGDAALDLK